MEKFEYCRRASREEWLESEHGRRESSAALWASGALDTGRSEPDGGRASLGFAGTEYRFFCGKERCDFCYLRGYYEILDNGDEIIACYPYEPDASSTPPSDSLIADAEALFDRAEHLSNRIDDLLDV